MISLVWLEPGNNILPMIRPSFFNYLVYGSADPIFHDFEKIKRIFFLLFSKKIFFTFFFTNFDLHVPSPEPG